MDPTENLKRQLRYAASLIHVLDYHPATEVERQACSLAELVIDLDHWIMSGGCLPESWAQKRDEIFRRRRGLFQP